MSLCLILSCILITKLIGSENPRCVWVNRVEKVAESKTPVRFLRDQGAFWFTELSVFLTFRLTKWVFACHEIAAYIALSDVQNLDTLSRRKWFSTGNWTVAYTPMCSTSTSKCGVLAPFLPRGSPNIARQLILTYCRQTNCFCVWQQIKVDCEIISFCTLQTGVKMKKNDARDLSNISGNHIQGIAF